jgi:hypothetical protein
MCIAVWQPNAHSYERGIGPQGSALADDFRNPEHDDHTRKLVDPVRKHRFCELFGLCFASGLATARGLPADQRRLKTRDIPGWMDIDKAIVAVTLIYKTRQSLQAIVFDTANESVRSELRSAGRSTIRLSAARDICVGSRSRVSATPYWCLQGRWVRDRANV